MANIETFLSEARTAKQADLVVNNTLRQLKQRSPALMKYAPVVEKDGRDWLAYIATQVDPIASIVAPGAEYPEAKKGEYSRVQARNFKVALCYSWDEDTLWRMDDLREIAKIRNISIQNVVVDAGQIQVGADNELVKTIFGSLASLVRGHINILDFLAWQVFQTGAMLYTDKRTGVKIDLDWKKAFTVEKNHFPHPVYALDALGTTNAGSLARDWTAFATCDPLQDMVDMNRVYKFTNGYSADEIAISSDLYLTLTRADSVKEAVVSANTLGNLIVGTPSVEQLNDVMRRRQLPPFVIVDDQVELNDTNGNPVKTYVHDRNRITFLSKQAQVQRILGGTQENKGKAGIFQQTRQKSSAPPLDVTETASMQLIAAPTIGKTGMSRIVTTTVNLDAAHNIADFNLV